MARELLRRRRRPSGYLATTWDVGAKSVGLNINLPHEQFPNPYITPGLCFRFHHFALRKLHFLLRAKALVAFPGDVWEIAAVGQMLNPIAAIRLADDQRER